MGNCNRSMDYRSPLAILLSARQLRLIFPGWMEVWVQYMLMPLNAHYDLGFGATANAYKHAADSLAESSPNLNSHLPTRWRTP